jgi:ABC-2 type transport system permease protein
MRRAAALLHASWLTARTYRVQLLLSVLALIGTLVPLYFVANALQPVMASRIQGEGDQYFAFLLLGMISLQLVQAAMSAMPTALSGALGSGVLEALMSTRARMSELLVGLSAYELCWTLVRCIALVGAGVALGAQLDWSRVLPALLIIGLVVAAHIPFGLLGAAFMLAFRAQSPISRVLTLVSGFLGGVYYPTSVIPGWLGFVSQLIPLSYGLKALRAVWLDGATLGSVATELRMLALMSLLLGALGVSLLSLALRHVRRVGGLSHL